MVMIYSAIVNGQFLSNLHADSNDPLFTTYAAPVERSEYTLDQAYEMQWADPQQMPGYTSEKGGTLSVLFRQGNEMVSKLQDYHAQPIIKTSYSDIMRMKFSPFENIDVRSVFNVYSSSSAIWEMEIENSGEYPAVISVFPLFEMKGMHDIHFTDGAWIFEHEYARDGWMKNHDIPVVEQRRSYFGTNAPLSGYYQFACQEDFFSMLAAERGGGPGEQQPAALLVMSSRLELAPGESKKLRIIRAIQPGDEDSEKFIASANDLFEVDLPRIIRKNEEIYSHIPSPEFENRDHALTYYSAFNLMRQCMMPPEGESSYNYYIFSREPKWGWGYGGQVFHESLVMLAYAFMDPISAMNSQRVYMERQDTAGFINYRSGPYLNENIPYNDQITSSAPWYNYQNLEVFSITKDTAFLGEAYTSGKKYYEYYTANRDADNDGLAEWGAHAVLESVRDARVAVWDKVGWPANFEGPDINAMLVMEAKSLAEMAQILGYTDEAGKFQKDAEKRTELINKYLWDPESAFFYNVDKKDNDFSFENKDDLKIKEIIGFLPLWAGIVDDERADSLLLSLTNKDEFWRNYGIPTLSADHPYYNPIGYWNGPVWVQWNYLIFRGLLDYGYKKEAKQLAEKVMKNIIFHLKTDHTFWEFYSADDLQAGWNHTYIWTGIVARFMIDLKELNLKE